MITIKIPGYKEITLQHLVMDFNGTIAIDGILADGIENQINILSPKLDIHVITADTFGQAREQLKNSNCQIIIIDKENRDRIKLKYIRQLGKKSVVAFGNGRNDRLMLKEAMVGITILLEEGCAIETLVSGDLLVKNIPDAFDLLNNPLRLTATLRS